ncbi:MAG: aldolase/citrate lyase family protein [Polaromonas sp.]|nr:aldolase/citrate lyase family protein [Polaromonas sp.]
MTTRAYPPLPRMARPAPGISHTGTFVKTASAPVVEILALSGLDFLVIDAEHAPFDRGDIDLMLLASRACGIPVVVRVPDADASTILSMLDLGAAGLVVPHVDSVEQARRVVASARYRGGTRGFSSSPRSSGYGSSSMKNALSAGDGAIVLCQIESADAVEAAAAIAAVDGVDALFIGRADLALSMGYDSTAVKAVEEAVDHVIAVTRAAGKTVAMAVGNMADMARYQARGADWFVVSTDQGLLRDAAIGMFGERHA